MALPQILNASGNAHKEKRIHIDKRQMDYLNLNRYNRKYKSYNRYKTC